MIALLQAQSVAPFRPLSLEGRSRATAVWLMGVAVFVFAMIVVGGATRLTGSGLSITEWKPITGVIPPLNAQDWLETFAKYRATSQYRLVNQDITLSQFQVLFWWEWAHRVLGRGVGLVFAVPFVVLLVLRRIPQRLIGRCFGLLALGGLQGLVGWWMVKSGLEGRIAVAPERLAAHLGLALVLLSALVWTALDAWFGDTSATRPSRRPWGRAILIFAVGVYVQCLMGALVAGNSAGLVDTDWPLMGGRFVPDDYWQGALWTTLGHGRSAVQFNHRIMAYALLALGGALCVAAWRSSEWPRAPSRALFVTVGLLCLQAILGVCTLWLGDPLGLALAHQANAAVLLSSAVTLAWTTRRPSVI